MLSNIMLSCVMVTNGKRPPSSMSSLLDDSNAASPQRLALPTVPSGITVQDPRLEVQQAQRKSVQFCDSKSRPRVSNIPIPTTSNLKKHIIPKIYNEFRWFLRLRHIGFLRYIIISTSYCLESCPELGAGTRTHWPSTPLRQSGYSSY